MSPNCLSVITTMMRIMVLWASLGWMTTNCPAQDRADTTQPQPGALPDIWTAAKTGDVDAIKRLRDFDVEIDKPDESGVTPLCWAAMCGHADAVIQLLESGASVEARNQDGSTPLLAAAFLGRSETAKLLIENGADVNAANNAGDRPLNALQADWKLTRRVANDLQIEVDRERLEAGRQKTAELLKQRGAVAAEKQPGNAAAIFGFIALGVLGVLAVVTMIVVFVNYLEKKRTEAMQEVAADIGLEFSATQDEELLAKMKVFSLFNKGHSRKMKNVMKAETAIANLSIFDYQYTTGGGKNSHTHRHTVVAMESPSLNLPSFSLRPEGFLHSIGAALGMQDIDFENHQRFSDSFVLQGEDEAAIRDFFNQDLLELFAQRMGVTVESSPGLFIYSHGGRKHPDQIRDLMEQGYSMYAAFEDRLSDGEAPPSGSV